MCMPIYRYCIALLLPAKLPQACTHQEDGNTGHCYGMARYQ